MTITLELTKEQGQVFEDLLTTSLQALMVQEKALQMALSTEIAPEPVNRINSFLTEEIIPQRMIAAEILQTVRDAKERRIIIPNSSLTK